MIEAIVDGYVRLSDRRGLEGLLTHHRLLLKELEAQPKDRGLDLSGPMRRTIDEEMAAITAGLKKLPAQ